MMRCSMAELMDQPPYQTLRIVRLSTFHLTVIQIWSTMGCQAPAATCWEARLVVELLELGCSVLNTEEAWLMEVSPETAHRFQAMHLRGNG